MKINLTIKQLEIFAALADTLNFGTAAQVVHLSQPALSAAIRKMEEAVNAPLFDRTTRSVSLTPVGMELLKVTSRLMYDLESSLDDINAFVEGKIGRVRVTAAPSLAATFLPELLSKFEVAHPDVRVYIRDALLESSINALKMGEVDLALGSAMLNDDDLVHHELFHDRLVLVCRRDHSLGQHKQIKWSKLRSISNSPLIITSNLRRTIEAEYMLHGAHYHPTFEIEHTSTLIGFIMSNVGIGILPASLSSLLSFSQLHTLDIVSPEIRRSICVMHLKSRTLPPAAHLFIECCKEHATRYT